MKKAIISLITFIFLIFTLSGCRFIKSDISKMNIILALGIDGKADNYNISVRVFEASSPEDAKDAKTSVYEASGKTVSQAVNQLTSAIGNPPLLSQSSVIIIGEKTAQNGIKEIFEYFISDDYIGPSAAIVVSTVKAADIITSDELENFLPTDRFTNMIRAAWENGTGVNTKFAEAVVKCENRFSDFCLPVIEFDSSKHIVTKSAAIFRNDVMTKIIDEDTIKGLLFLSNHVKGGYLSVEDAGGESASLEIVKSSSTIQTNMDGGKITLNIKITAQFNVTEFENGKFSDETVDKLNKDISKEIKTLAENSYNKVVKENTSDPINIGRRLYIDREISSTLSDEEFRKMLSNSQVNIEADAKISRSGLF